MLDNLDIHGHVQCFEKGKMIWESDNKITYLGRSMMLAMLTHTDNISYKDNEYFDYTKDKPWRIHPESWISCFAVGNGAALNSSGVPTATSFKDTCMNRIIPFNTKDTIINSSLIQNKSDYIMLAGEEDSYQDIEVQSAGKGYVITKSNVTKPTDLFDIKKYCYFKRCALDTFIKPASYSAKDNDRFKNIGIEGSIMTMMLELTISEGDFIREDRENNFINELSLYIGHYDTADPGENKLREFTSVFEQDSDNEEIMKKLPCVPVQFSHISFPNEIFTTTGSRSLTFRYYIYA